MFLYSLSSVFKIHRQLQITLGCSKKVQPMSPKAIYFNPLETFYFLNSLQQQLKSSLLHQASSVINTVKRQRKTMPKLELNSVVIHCTVHSITNKDKEGFTCYLSLQISQPKKHSLLNPPNFLYCSCFANTQTQKPLLSLQDLHEDVPGVLQSDNMGFAGIHFVIAAEDFFAIVNNGNIQWDWFMWRTGLQSSMEWDINLICSFSSKPSKNIRGQQKPQLLFKQRIDNPGTQPWQPILLTGWNCAGCGEQSCPTQLQACPCQNTKWRQEKVHFWTFLTAASGRPFSMLHVEEESLTSEDFFSFWPAFSQS